MKGAYNPDYQATIAARTAVPNPVAKRLKRVLRLPALTNKEPAATGGAASGCTCLARIGTSPIVLVVVLVLDFFGRGKRAELPTTLKDRERGRGRLGEYLYGAKQP